jgi:hypothetical protein
MEISVDTAYKTESVPLQIKYKGKKYTGEAKPVKGSCKEGACFELDVKLNGELLGTIYRNSGGWSMDRITDQEFIDAIGDEIFLWYE